MVKKVAFLFIAIALVALSVVGIGCGAEKGTAAIDLVPQGTPGTPAMDLVPQGTPAIDLVPQGADFVADVSLYQIFTDRDLLNLVNEIGAKLDEPKTVGELVDELKQETGIDLHDFSKIVVFGATEFEDYVGAIVKGEFDQENLIASIGSRSGVEMTTTSYKGYELYLVTNEDEEVAITLLDDYSIALGDTVAVEDVIDVKEGATGLSGPVYEAYASMDDAWFRAAAEVPEEASGDIPFGEVPIPMEALEDVRAAGFSFNKLGQAVSAQFKLYFATSDAAATTGELLETLMGFIGFLPDVPPEVGDILEELSVSVSGNWVTILLETTIGEIESLIRQIELPEGIELPD